MSGVDLLQTIKELTLERQRLDDSIRHLEHVLQSGNLRRGPGRRSMPQSERQVVSMRMKRYWADRRDTKRESKPATKETGQSAVLVMAKSA